MKKIKPKKSQRQTQTIADISIPEMLINYGKFIKYKY